MKSEHLEQGESNFPNGLSQPALRALAGANFTRLEDLTKVSEAELKKMHGIGPNALKKLRSALEAQGLSFADKKNTNQ